MKQTKEMLRQLQITRLQQQQVMLQQQAQMRKQIQSKATVLYEKQILMYKHLSNTVAAALAVASNPSQDSIHLAGVPTSAASTLYMMYAAQHQQLQLQKQQYAHMLTMMRQQDAEAAAGRGQQQRQGGKDREAAGESAP